MMGGVPCGGLRFGAAQNADAHLASADILDFYNGGGINVAVLGMAEVRPELWRSQCPGSGVPPLPLDPKKL
jgi:acyl CoA:acetate/3-ketoacid CoA transferase